MESLVSITYEIGDMIMAAQQLAEGIDKKRLKNNSIGILFCDSQLDEPGLVVKHLYGSLKIDIIGCTTTATLNREDGASDMCTLLTVLTAEDVYFYPALSDTIGLDTAEQVVTSAYQASLSQMAGKKPEVIIAFSALIKEVMLDLYPQVLSKLSQNTPVFGGLSGYNAPYGYNGVFFNGEIHENKMVLVLITGNIRPLFSIGSLLSHVADERRVVTKSDQNVIYTVDDMTLTAYLDQIGFDTKVLAEDQSETLFVANPFILSDTEDGKEDLRLIRIMHHLNLDCGSGVAIGLVPQGYHIAIGMLTKTGIHMGALNSIKELLEQIKQKEKADPTYRYNVILATSCIGRYMVMMPQIDMEGNIFKDLIPPHINFTGYYGYGEIGPTSVVDGVAVNTVQNASITLCAF